MTEENHERAKGLIAAGRVEGISAANREWLDAHLQRCQGCLEFANTMDHAIRSLHLFSVQVNPDLVDRTRRAVRLRARELQGRQSQLFPLWMSCAVSWVLGGLTLPLVWQGIEWVGRYMNLPSSVEILLLIIWWSLPALGVAAFIGARGSRAEDEL